MSAGPSQPVAGRPKPWYQVAFQEAYLDLYMHRDQREAARAVQFLQDALRFTPEDRLLDLCCGPGRHLALLGRKVGVAVGLDLSLVLLRRARRHFVALGGGEDGPAEKTGPLLVQADMLRLPLDASAFDHVVNLFTSFGYFEREVENQGVLAEVARVLRPGGMLALDHINAPVMLGSLEPRSERQLPDGRHLIEVRRWDAHARRVEKDITCQRPDGLVRRWHESVRVYQPDELESMMRSEGLEPVARHGDYDGSPWREEAPRMILLARRVEPNP